MKNENVIKVNLDGIMDLVAELKGNYGEVYAKPISQKERDKLPDSNFIVPENRSFYIRKGHPEDISNAFHSFGRGKNDLSYSEFAKRAVRIAKRLGMTKALPETVKREFGIKD